MESALKISPRSKIATAGALNHIRFSMFQLAGTGDLSPLGRRWLFFLVSLVRMGYSEIRASMYDITQAQYRSQGQTSSQSTAYRGLKLMEGAGFIRRQRYRVGPDRFRVIVYINVEHFTQWLTDTPHIQGVTPDYINSQLSNCERTQDPDQGSHVPPPTLHDLSVNKHPRATSSKEHLIKKTLGKGKRQDTPERREHPIVYSIRMATAGQGKKRRAVLLELARREAEHPFDEQSGAPWMKWCKRDQRSGRILFEELSIPHEREFVARQEFLPYLEDMAGLDRIAPVVKALVERGSRPQSREAQEEDRRRRRNNEETLHPSSIPSKPQPTASDVKAWLKDSPFDREKAQRAESELPSKQEVSAMLQDAGLGSALRGHSGGSGEVPAEPRELDPKLRRELEQRKSRVEQARANLGIAEHPGCTPSEQ